MIAAEHVDSFDTSHVGTGWAGSWSIEELRASRQRLPAAPGVYTFLDTGDRPLYVGKSVDLRSRVSSYFAAAHARRKTARMVSLAATVRAERTGSEFAALLREAVLVQALRPPFNQRMAAPERYVYLRVDYAHPYPRVSVTGTPAAEGRYFGPYMQRQRVTAVVDGLNDAFRLRTCDPIPTEPCWRLQMRRCCGPCVGQIACGDYGREFLVVREALSGRAHSALRRLRERRQAHAAAERFESARAAQDCIDAVERLRRVLFASQVPSPEAIIVQPALAADAVEIWGIRGGSVRCGGSGPRADMTVLFERVWAGLRAGAVDDAPVDKCELDQRCIVQRWIRSRRGAASCVPTSGLTPVEAWRRVAELAVRQKETLL